MTDHDSLAQPSPFRTVRSVATGDTAAVDRDRGPEDAAIPPFEGQRGAIPVRSRIYKEGTMGKFDGTQWTDNEATAPDAATIAAIRKRMTRAEYPSFTRFSFDDVRDLFSALDAVTAERDAMRADNAALLALTKELRTQLGLLDGCMAWDGPHNDDGNDAQWQIDNVDLLDEVDGALATEHSGTALLAVVDAAQAWANAQAALSAAFDDEKETGWGDRFARAHSARDDAEDALAAAIARLPR